MESPELAIKPSSKTIIRYTKVGNGGLLALKTTEGVRSKHERLGIIPAVNSIPSLIITYACHLFDLQGGRDA